MRVFNFTVLSSAVLSVVVACASPSAGPSADKATPSAVTPVDVEHFVGTVTTTSPDGATPYGPPTQTVARRRFLSNPTRIEEDVFHDGHLALTTLTPREPQGDFSASDAAPHIESNE